MKIDFVGDIHGQYDVLRALAMTTDADVIVQIGDFGIMPKAMPSISEIAPFNTQTLFIEGNHDDYSYLCGQEWYYACPPGLEHVQRATERTLGPWEVAFLGGGWSIDKRWRTEGVNWYPDEQPSKVQLERFATLRPDIAVTHEGPSRILASMFGYDWFNATADGLDNLIQHVPEFQPKLWLFGHHHPRELEFYPCGEIDFICLPEYTGRKNQIFRVRGESLQKAVQQACISKESRP